MRVRVSHFDGGGLAAWGPAAGLGPWACAGCPVGVLGFSLAWASSGAQKCLEGSHKKTIPGSLEMTRGGLKITPPEGLWGLLDARWAVAKAAPKPPLAGFWSSPGASWGRLGALSAPGHPESILGQLLQLRLRKLDHQ